MRGGGWGTTVPITEMSGLIAVAALMAAAEAAGSWNYIVCRGERSNEYGVSHYWIVEGSYTTGTGIYTYMYSKINVYITVVLSI